MTEFAELEPRPVQRIETRYRRIVTPLPAPETVPILEKLYRYEPVAMRGQPPIVWDRAEGFQVYDVAGNCWIDWSSGVLITNAGHGRPEVIEAIERQIRKPLLATFAFASEVRARLVERLVRLLPEPLNKVFLFSTGSEAIECAIKFARTYGVRKGGKEKHVIVSFLQAFHGRTLGAQLAGGFPELKEWIVNLDPGFVQVPFPDGYWVDDISFDFFLHCLDELGIRPRQVAAVLMETYQGATACFAPPEYVRQLRQWCDENDVLLIFDEIQAGFGRTGKLFAFEHYGVTPDLATFGKGMSGSLPQSACAGRADVLDLHPPLSMTNTHAGNPVCCAATLANLDLIEREGLVERSARLGQLLHDRLRQMKARFPHIGYVAGKGLVAGIGCVIPGTRKPDGALAREIVRRAMEKGVLMFAPVGYGGATLKICPPLVIPEDALVESLEAFEEAFAEAIEARTKQACA